MDTLKDFAEKYKLKIWENGALKRVYMPNGFLREFWQESIPVKAFVCVNDKGQLDFKIQLDREFFPETDLMVRRSVQKAKLLLEIAAKKEFPELADGASIESLENWESSVILGSF